MSFRDLIHWEALLESTPQDYFQDVVINVKTIRKIFGILYMFKKHCLDLNFISTLTNSDSHCNLGWILFVLHVAWHCRDDEVGHECENTLHCINNYTFDCFHVPHKLYGSMYCCNCKLPTYKCTSTIFRIYWIINKWELLLLEWYAIIIINIDVLQILFLHFLVSSFSHNLRK